jgi:hypothetical protein
MIKPFTIDTALVEKILGVIDVGLISGKGIPQPGRMCVEAAICFALGEPHGDEPSCVAPAVRRFKIALNDAAWSSDLARAKGLRRIAIAQLGSAGTVNEIRFAKVIIGQTIRRIVPIVLRAAAAVIQIPKHRESLKFAALRCERKGSLRSSLRQER